MTQWYLSHQPLNTVAGSQPKEANLYLVASNAIYG